MFTQARALQEVGEGARVISGDTVDWSHQAGVARDEETLRKKQKFIRQKKKETS